MTCNWEKDSNAPLAERQQIDNDNRASAMQGDREFELNDIKESAKNV